MGGRRQLSKGPPSSANAGRDTADNDLVIHEGDILTNESHNCRYVLSLAVDVLFAGSLRA